MDNIEVVVTRLASSLQKAEQRIEELQRELIGMGNTLTRTIGRVATLESRISYLEGIVH